MPSSANQTVISISHREMPSKTLRSHNSCIAELQLAEIHARINIHYANVRRLLIISRRRRRLEEILHREEINSCLLMLMRGCFGRTRRRDWATDEGKWFADITQAAHVLPLRSLRLIISERASGIIKSIEARANWYVMRAPPRRIHAIYDNTSRHSAESKQWQVIDLILRIKWRSALRGEQNKQGHDSQPWLLDNHFISDDMYVDVMSEMGKLYCETRQWRLLMNAHNVDGEAVLGIENVAIIGGEPSQSITFNGYL